VIQLYKLQNKIVFVSTTRASIRKWTTFHQQYCIIRNGYGSTLHNMNGIEIPDPYCESELRQCLGIAKDICYTILESPEKASKWENRRFLIFVPQLEFSMFQTVDVQKCNGSTFHHTCQQMDRLVACCPRNAFQKWRRFFCRRIEATGWITWPRKTACLLLTLISTNENLQKMISGKNMLRCIRPSMVKVGDLCVAFIYKIKMLI